MVQNVATSTASMVYRNPMDSELTELVRQRLYQLAKTKRFRRDALAERLGVVESAVTKNLITPGRPLTIGFVEAAAALADVPVAELLCPQGSEIKQVDAEEASLLRYLRQWPRTVRRALLAFVQFFSNEDPADTQFRNLREHWRHLNATDRERLNSYAVIFREKVLTPDQEQALNGRLRGLAARERARQGAARTKRGNDDDST
jgi:transcriptional regulator with XRE-family HTH domain